MAELSTYCICKCPNCGNTFHEWLFLRNRFTSSFEYCWCLHCRKLGLARVVPADLHYRY